MTTNKHTPGPWMAYNLDGNSGRILKHWRIKGACVRNDPSFAVIDSGGKLSPEYEAANARLIAAAPELLEALEDLIHCLNNITSEQFAHGFDKMARDKAIEAIRTAKGEQ